MYCGTFHVCAKVDKKFIKHHKQVATIQSHFTVNCESYKLQAPVSLEKTTKEFIMIHVRSKYVQMVGYLDHLSKFSLLPWTYFNLKHILEISFARITSHYGLLFSFFLVRL